VKGLPRVALFVASALAFDSLTEALPFFDVTAKTARSKLESALYRPRRPGAAARAGGRARG
jgi:hypothetical protein